MPFLLIVGSAGGLLAIGIALLRLVKLARLLGKLCVVFSLVSNVWLCATFARYVDPLLLFAIFTLLIVPTVLAATAILIAGCYKNDDWSPEAFESQRETARRN